MPHGHGHSDGHETFGSGSMLLDIGGEIGALVIHTGPEHSEVEIEISPCDNGTARTHNQVHARHNRHGTSYSAVFPSVPAGEYTIWGSDDTPAASVVVHGGRVTEHHWK